TQTRIQALRASMKNFYDTVAAATSGTNARIRYGFVPYSSSVNVGRLILDRNPAYLVDNWTIQSRLPIYRTVQTQTGYGTPTTTTGTPTTTTPTYGSWSNYNSTLYLTSSSCSAQKP
ncbi:MAG: pilus assembly protein TadG, partial [Novosphingobium sp.]